MSRLNLLIGHTKRSWRLLPTNPYMLMKYIRSIALTLFVFGLLGWLYIVLNSEIHMWTLSMPLTHILPYPREDTFGIICFLVSMISFFIWDVTRLRD